MGTMLFITQDTDDVIDHRSQTTRELRGRDKFPPAFLPSTRFSL